jgi:hypothetical protein
MKKLILILVTVIGVISFLAGLLSEDREEKEIWWTRVHISACTVAVLYSLQD